MGRNYVRPTRSLLLDFGALDLRDLRQAAVSGALLSHLMHGARLGVVRGGTWRRLP